MEELRRFFAAGEPPICRITPDQFGRSREKGDGTQMTRIGRIRADLLWVLPPDQVCPSALDCDRQCCSRDHDQYAILRKLRLTRIDAGDDPARQCYLFNGRRYSPPSTAIWPDDGATLPARARSATNPSPAQDHSISTTCTAISSTSRARAMRGQSSRRSPVICTPCTTVSENHSHRGILAFSGGDDSVGSVFDHCWAATSPISRAYSLSPLHGGGHRCLRHRQPRSRPRRAVAGACPADRRQLSGWAERQPNRLLVALASISRLRSSWSKACAP